MAAVHQGHQIRASRRLDHVPWPHQQRRRDGGTTGLRSAPRGEGGPLGVTTGDMHQKGIVRNWCRDSGLGDFLLDMKLSAGLELPHHYKSPSLMILSRRKVAPFQRHDALRTVSFLIFVL